MYTTGHLGVGPGHDIVDDDQTGQPSDGDGGEAAASEEEQLTDQVRPVGEHDRKHGA